MVATKKAKKQKTASKTAKSISQKEAEEIILDLGRSGISSEKIGQILKDEHGVQSTKELAGRRITKILRENNASPKLPADLDSLMKSAVAIKKHLIKHKSDMAARYGLLLTESKIRKLAKYYRNSKVLPADWKYEAEVQV